MFEIEPKAWLGWGLGERSSTQIIESQNILCWKGLTGIITVQLLALHRTKAAEVSKCL